MITTLIIDEEFKNLIPPLSDVERKGLENSILKEGCRDAIITWHGVIVDGHNRYEICTKHNIPYKTVQREFESREAVIEWIILNQFGRRNLPAHERARLALRLKPVIAEKAKEKQESGVNQYTKSLPQNSAEASAPIETRQELAKAAGVSHDTIAKVEKIEEQAPAPVVLASRKGEISVNSAYEVTKLEPQEQAEIAHRIEHSEEKPKAIIHEVLKRPHVANNSGNNEWYTPAELIEAARDTMGEINLDPASNPIANKVVKADKYYTAEDNGLDKIWSGNVWLNPPYASDLIEKFIDKLVSERNNYTQAIVLVNNATETVWFNKIIDISAAVCFPKSRVKFYMPNGKTGAPLQGQAVLYIGENSNRFVNAFSKIGWCCNVIR